MLPGPVSNAITSSGLPSGGNRSDVRNAADVQRNAPELRNRRTADSRRMERAAPLCRRPPYRAYGNRRPPEFRAFPPAPIRHRSAACFAARDTRSARGIRPVRSCSAERRICVQPLHTDPASTKFRREIARRVRVRIRTRPECVLRTLSGYGSVQCATTSIRLPSISTTGDVDAIERRAAHDARDSHGRLSSCCNSASSFNASIGRSSSTLMRRMRSAIS